VKKLIWLWVVTCALGSYRRAEGESIASALPALPTLIVSHVIGTDNRIPITESPLNAEPFGVQAQSVGRLHYSDDTGGHSCTASLVGWRLVMTAKHCINFDADVYFYPYYLDGNVPPGFRPLRVVDWRRGDYPGYGNRAGDWVVAALEAIPKGQGGYLGFLPVIEYPGLGPGKTVTMAGYSGDRFSRTPGVHYNCRVNSKDFNNVISYECDSTGGSSGGPVVVWHKGEYKLTGIHVAQSNEGVPENYAVSAENFLDAIVDMRDRYPQ